MIPVSPDSSAVPAALTMVLIRFTDSWELLAIAKAAIPFTLTATPAAFISSVALVVAETVRLSATYVFFPIVTEVSLYISESLKLSSRLPKPETSSAFIIDSVVIAVVAFRDTLPVSPALNTFPSPVVSDVLRC